MSELHDAILNGNAKAAVAITRRKLDEGSSALDLVSSEMIPAMDEIGGRFAREECFVPELLLAARAMKGALELLQPLLAKSGAQPAGRVAIGTVKGDLHDIGKNLVAAMLEGAGFEVIDLGIDVAADSFVEAVRTRKVDVICLSALLTVAMPAMRDTIAALRDAGVRGRVKVLVGGAPITPAFAQQIGADGYGENATSAVTLARQMTATAS